MKHIIMAVTNDLVTDQRVHRSCSALTQAGLRVTLVGRRLPDSPAMAPRDYSTCRMSLLFRRSALFYAEYNMRLFLRLLFSRADAFYANDTDTLLAAAWAARIRRKKLFFDAHELFPDVPELVDKPRVQAVWRWVERHCLPQVDAAFTVCQSVADEYRKRYQIDMAVVRNLPEPVEVSQPSPVTLQPNTILYQGAVNLGRGVRELIDAMQYLPQCHLAIAGDGDIRQSLQHYAARLPWSSRISFLGRIAPAQLHALTPQAAVGVCLLENLGLNYQYSLPNRIADFAAASVPIVATDFIEIRRVVDQFRIGTLVPPCPQSKSGSEYTQYIKDLARTIDTTIAQWSAISPQQRQALFSPARTELSWTNEKKILVNKINNTLLR